MHGEGSSARRPAELDNWLWRQSGLGKGGSAMCAYIVRRLRGGNRPYGPVADYEVRRCLLGGLSSTLAPAEPVLQRRLAAQRGDK